MQIKRLHITAGKINIDNNITSGSNHTFGIITAFSGILSKAAIFNILQCNY